MRKQTVDAQYMGETQSTLKYGVIDPQMARGVLIFAIPKYWMNSNKPQQQVRVTVENVPDSD